MAEPCSQAVDDIDALVADPARLVWVDICDPTPDELARIGAEVGLDPHALEDALAPGERPKATRHPTHAFFTVYRATLDRAAGDALHDSRLVTARVSAFVLPMALITVRRGDGFPIDEVEQRWAEDPELLRHGTGALVHGLLDWVVDEHFATIQALDDATDRIEDALFEPAGVRRDEIQQRVYRLRKELVELRRIVLPMREVVAALMRGREGERDHALDGYYQDLYDHVMRATEWTESLRDMVGAIFETNLSLQDAHLNVVMKKLAGWAAVIAVPTAVTGWFGQNVPFPGNGQPIGLAYSIIAIALGTIGVYALLRKVDWI